MSIEEIGGYAATTSQSQLTGGSSLGKDEFLNLLVTQLQYQDPLNPMDSTDFTAQLAQFSSLEQLTNLNEKFDALTQSQAALNNTQAVSYIGQTVLVEGGTLVSDGMGSVDCHFELAGPTEAVFVSVYDGSGQLVRTFDAGTLGSGYQKAAWDGCDQDGNPLPAGAYQFEVAAVDSENAAVDVTTLSTGQVTGVTFRNGTAYVAVAGGEFAVGDIRQVTTSTQ